MRSPHAPVASQPLTLSPLAQPPCAPSKGATLLRLARLVLGRLLIVIGALVVFAPMEPGVGGLLAAAATARANLRYDRALELYSVASARMPYDPLPYCLSGQVYTLQREWGAAIAANRRCASLNSDDGASWLALGDSYNAVQSETAAADAWKRAASRGDMRAWRRLALLAETQGSFAAAQADWQRLPSDDLQALTHLGLLALERGDSATAQTDFFTVRSRPNSYADFLVDTGFVVFAAQAPTGADGLGRLGYTFLAANMPRFALAPLRAATRLAPTNGIAHVYLGWTLRLLGQNKAARQEISLGSHLAPGLSFSWFAVGEVALTDGDAAQAESAFAHGLQLDQRNPALWDASASALLAIHQYVPAELALHNAAQLSTDPAYTAAFLRFYVDYDVGYNDGRATFAATAAVTRFPTNEPIRFLLAEIYNEAFQPSFAYYACEAAHQLDPTDPAPYVFLARVAVGEGAYVTAALDLRTALALRPHGLFAAEARALLAPLAAVGD